MRLESFLVCDLIRQEISKKTLIVGAYDSEIALTTHIDQSKPFIALPTLALFIRFRSVSENEDFPVRFKLIHSFNIDGQKANEFVGDVKKDSKETGVTFLLTFAPFVIPINANKLDFKICLIYSDGHNELHELSSLKISFTEPTLQSTLAVK
jgi:hypothetical protein